MDGGILIHISSPALVKLYRNKKFNNKVILASFENEIDNLLSLVNFCKKNKVHKLVLFSTSSIYGKNLHDKPFSENNPLLPGDYYSSIKLAVEKLAKKIFKNTIIIRPFQVYGKFDNKKRLVPTLMSSKNTLNLQNCLQVTDLIHVEDLCEAVLSLCNSQIKYGEFNIGSGKPIKLRKVVNTIHKFRKKIFKFSYKENDKKTIDNYCYADISKLKKMTGWKPKISFIKGLSKL